MDVTTDMTATLRAETRGHAPCVLESAGFCTEHSARSRSIGYGAEKSPTLRAGVIPAAIALENHPADSRVKVSEDNTVQTLTSRMGTGGGNIPLILDADIPKTIKIRSGCEGGGKGGLIQEDMSATLSCSNDQTVFVPKAYGISSDQSHAMLSDNPHSGIYEAETARTLDRSGGNPSCNQGGIAIVEPREVYAMTTGSFSQVAENQAPTIMARDYKDPAAVVYGIGRDAFNQGKNAQFPPTVKEELQPTLTAKGPGAVQSGYTVRRLTPTECARLQGFPDWWCSGLETNEPTEEDVEHWAEIFETFRRITGSDHKPKSKNQIIKWLKNPHSDSAEYKMWGNGVALPCVIFVLAGIVYCTQSIPD